MFKLAFLCLVAVASAVHYYDLPDETRQGMLGTKLDGNSFSQDHEIIEMTETEAAETLASMPASFDAKQKWPKCAGVIGYIKNQAACGSCWAVAASEVIEDRMCIWHGAGSVSGPEPANENNLVRPPPSCEKISDWQISAEDLMTCCTSCGNGCQGGYPIDAMRYWATTGLPSGGYYGSQCGCKAYGIDPSLRTLQPTPRCTQSCDTKGFPTALAKDRFRAKRYYQVRGEAAMMKEIMTNGPIECGFTVHQSFETFFKNPSNAKKTYMGSNSWFDKVLGGHAIKIIGWGTDSQGNKFWLINNSWDCTWADHGIFRFKRGGNLDGMEAQCVAGMPANMNNLDSRMRCAKRDFPQQML